MLRWRDLLLLLIAGAAFVFSVYGAVAYAVVEKRFPTEMLKFVFWFGLPLVFLIAWTLH